MWQNKTSHRCQSKAGVSIKALILLSSSALLGGGASKTGLLDWTGTTSGMAYKSFPNSSHSESSGYKFETWVTTSTQYKRHLLKNQNMRKEHYKLKLTYFMADESAPTKLLFVGWASSTLFSTLGLQNKINLEKKKIQSAKSLESAPQLKAQMEDENDYPELSLTLVNK